MVDPLVGMQWGSEGKGKVIEHLADEYNAMVRSGGPQAGHTFYDDIEAKHVLRQVPCGVINDGGTVFLEGTQGFGAIPQSRIVPILHFQGRNQCCTPGRCWNCTHTLRSNHRCYAHLPDKGGRCYAHLPDKGGRCYAHLPDKGGWQ